MLEKGEATVRKHLKAFIDVLALLPSLILNMLTYTILHTCLILQALLGPSS